MARVKIQAQGKGKGGENFLKPGWFIRWHRQTYHIIKPDDGQSSLLIKVVNLATGEPNTFTVEELLLPDQTSPGVIDETAVAVFAPTLEQLESLSTSGVSSRRIGDNSEAGLSPQFIARAETLITTVETVNKLLADHQRRALLQGEKWEQTEALKIACRQLDNQIGLTTFYKYQKIYQTYDGDKAKIASSFHRTTYNQTALTPSQLHFMDTLIMRYYARSRPLRPSKLYELAKAVLERTQNRWIDPAKLVFQNSMTVKGNSSKNGSWSKSGQAPLNLIEELLDHRLPLKAILENPEKARLLMQINLPSRSWFYEYLNWFVSQSDQGRKVITTRYGKEAWEREFLIFDTFATNAGLPLQYVFADHWLMDVFIVDEATRSKIDRLWLTVLIDAYSRSILGMALMYESPCIESIQTALAHAIFPKTSHQALGLLGEWPVYGIPQQLSLDNAWAHHSHSLENLARQISQGGRFGSIDLVFRPPYRGRYGALIERFFGNLSARVKETLPGAIHSSNPKVVSDAAKQACLLFQDIYSFVHEEILAYQNTVHKDLDGLTPNQKWQEGLIAGRPLVPTLTEAIARLFWRKHTETRTITSQGICAFGLHYYSPTLAGAERKSRQGRWVEYGLAYNPSDISTLALFREGQWVCDVFAKELRQPDGSYREISIWEKQLARDLAVDDGKAARDWLEHLNEVEELTTTRQIEQKKARRKEQITTSKPGKLQTTRTKRSAAKNKALEETLNKLKEQGQTQLSQIAEDEYTRLIANFVQN